MKDTWKKLSDIPTDCSYVGYLWLSDKSEPNPYYTPTQIVLGYTDNSNPFIVEGQLYSEQLQKSYSIKYVDGNHIVIEYDLQELNKKENWKKVEKSYIPNRFEASALRFIQYWGNEADEFCENMEVLVPKASVFVGFNENKKL